MKQNDKLTLEQETKRKYLFLRFKAGLHEILHNKRKTFILVVYFGIAFIAWILRDALFGMNTDNVFALAYKGMINLILPIGVIGGLVFLIIKFGSPVGAKRINDNLWRVGLVNHATEMPFLMKRHRDKNHPDITVLEFEANGIPLSEFEKQQAKIETALNIHIAKITQGTNKQRIILHTVSGNRDLPKILNWQDDFLSGKSFELILGESLLGRETVNLAQIPHILLGGSTGSGKSVLLKLLIMQCAKKGALVFIADFKGAVDYPLSWYSNCRIITDEKTLLATLSQIIDVLEERKELLRKYECVNIDEFNKAAEFTLPRMVFAVDEIAEVFDKTGLDKTSKELITQIEGKLSTIARQGRAFGIHLILATQRPDANILCGQIKNNVNYRICGRADNVLSQIILDNADAADKIPKDAQGRFLTNEGIVFQGYLFDEATAFNRRRTP